MIRIYLIVFYLFAVSTYAEDLLIAYENLRPNHFQGADNKVVGKDADILVAIFKRMNQSYKFEERPWKRTLQDLGKGTIHVGIGAKYLDERAKFTHYSLPYKTITHNFYTLQSGKQYSSLKNYLDDKNKLGLVIGWGYPDNLASILNSNKYKQQGMRLPSFEQLPKMLFAKRLNGIIAEPQVISTYISKEHPISLVESFNEKLHFLFSKKRVNQAFVDKFNVELQKMLDSAEIEKIRKKYK